ILLGIAVLTGFYAITSLPAETFMSLLVASVIVALIAVLIATFVPSLAMPMSIVYAAAEGVLLAMITLVAHTFVPGAPYAAIIATTAIFFVMLFLYSSRIIRVTTRFRKIMYAVLFGILFFFIGFGIMSLFVDMNVIFGNSYELAIGISVFLIIYGALMLTLDFDRAEAIVSRGADKKYEWMVALGLMVTIVWLYIEILRLIMIVASKRK
ncbi:MAG: Bax inhibitor-1/YccA family membrane protein, partial [Acholeplasmataceae bacterium]